VASNGKEEPRPEVTRGPRLGWIVIDRDPRGVTRLIPWRRRAEHGAKVSDRARAWMTTSLATGRTPLGSVLVVIGPGE
jgi:hypothetical protein